VSVDIRTDIWTKLMGNCSLNCIAALTHAALDAMLTHTATRALIEAMMTEMLQVAAAVSEYVPPMTISERLELSSRLGAFKPSTLQDVECGRRLEVGALIGAIVELAARFGVSVVNLSAVAAMLELRSRVLELSSASVESCTAVSDS
jgi:2-dehydropantoate 2-reductase